MHIHGLKNLTWDIVPANFWVVTVDLHGLVSCHSDVPRYVTAASKWTSTTRRELGLTSTHPDDSPQSRFEVRPGLEAPRGFPQVISPVNQGLAHQPRPLEPMKPPVQTPEPDLRGTIPSPHMTAMMKRRNDNTDPTVAPVVPPVAKAPKATKPGKEAKAPAPVVAPVPVVAPAIQSAPKKKGKEAKVAPDAPLLSSPQTVYTALTHILRVLQELKDTEPNYTAIDYHVGEIESTLAARWPIKEFEA